MSDERIQLTTYFDGYPLGKSQKIFLWIIALSYAFDLMDATIDFGVCHLFTCCHFSSRWLV